MMECLADDMVKAGTSQTPLFSNASTYKSIRVFSRKTNDPEPSAKMCRKDKKSKGASDEFSAFYSPTHYQYDSLKRGKLDISTIFKKIPVSRKSVRSPEQTMIYDRQTQFRTATEIANNSPPQMRVSNPEDVLLTQLQPKNLEVDTTDNSILSQQCCKQCVSMGSRVSQLEILVRQLASENSRLKRESVVMQPGVSSMEILDNADNNCGLFGIIDQLSCIVDEHHEESKISSSYNKVSGHQRAGEQQLIREIKNKAQLINELSEQLTNAQQQITRLKNSVHSYELKNDELNKQLAKYKQSTNYLEAQLHVHRHWRSQQPNSLQLQASNKKLLEVNGKLREELIRLKLRQRHAGHELFQLTPDNSDNES